MDHSNNGSTETLTWSQFEQIDMRCGTIVEALDFPKAKAPAYKLLIDFGPVVGTRRSSAQITARYSREELLNRQVVAVINFPPKQIADYMSECLVLGVYDEAGDVILLAPGKPVTNGLKIG